MNQNIELIEHMFLLSLMKKGLTGFDVKASASPTSLSADIFIYKAYRDYCTYAEILRPEELAPRIQHSVSQLVLFPPPKTLRMVPVNTHYWVSAPVTKRGCRK